MCIHDHHGKTNLNQPCIFADNGTCYYLKYKERLRPINLQFKTTDVMKKKNKIFVEQFDVYRYYDNKLLIYH